MGSDNKKDYSSVQCKIFEGTDNIFDEKGSMYLAMRKVAWYSKGKEEPTEDKAKLELRKWLINKDGEEIPQKGFSFLTENGPHDLAKMLVHNGYGDTKELLKELKNRKDFKESVNHMYDDNSENTSEYFDARSALLSA